MGPCVALFQCCLIPIVLYLSHIKRSIRASSFSVQDGSTALHLASQNGHCEVVRMLLKAKADVNARTNVSKSYSKLVSSCKDPL